MHSLVTFLIVLAAIAVPLIVVGIGSHIAAIHAPQMPGWPRVKGVAFGFAWIAIFIIPQIIVAAYAFAAHLIAVVASPLAGLLIGLRSLASDLAIDAWTHVLLVKALICSDIEALTALQSRTRR